MPETAAATTLKTNFESTTSAVSVVSSGHYSSANPVSRGAVAAAAAGQGAICQPVVLCTVPTVSSTELTVSAHGDTARAVVPVNLLLPPFPHSGNLESRLIVCRSQTTSECSLKI